LWFFEFTVVWAILKPQRLSRPMSGTPAKLLITQGDDRPIFASFWDKMGQII
jgi:hypothetical protein